MPTATKRVISNKLATTPRQMATSLSRREENCERKPRNAVSTPKTSWIYGAMKSAGGGVSLDNEPVNLHVYGHSPGNMKTAAAVQPLLSRACKPID